MKEITIKGIDETVYYDECDNGLKLYIWVNEKVQSVYMSLAVKYGSVHTDFTIKKDKFSVPNGSAHFLEHVKFNERDGSTAHDFFYKTGAEINAFTTFDFTSYYVLALDKIEENLNHLLDYVQDPYFTDKLIEKEKGIISQEEKMGQDNVDTVHYFGIFENLFHSSKYKNLVTGNLEDIENTTTEDMELIFNSFYHPKNMALFITGNVNPHEIKMLVNQNQNSKYFEEYKNPKVIIPKEKYKVVEEKRELYANVSQPKMKIGIKIPRSNFSDYDDFDLRLAMNMILNINFGNTSDISDYLLSNHLATYINATTDIYDDYLIIVVSTETKFPQDVEKLIKDKLNNLEIDKSVFERKIKALIATFILNYDSIERVNSLLQDDYINYGKIMDNAKERYESLNLKTLLNIVKLLNFENITSFVMLPDESK